MSGPRPGEPGSVPTAIDIRHAPSEPEKTSDTPAGTANRPAELEPEDSYIPGMDYNPPITSELVIAEAEDGPEGTGREQSGPPVPAVGQTAAPATESAKDRFSLSELESALARSMRPRTAEAAKPADPQRLARSGTFVWDVEKLGPPQRKKTDRRPGAAWLSAPMSPQQPESPVPATGTFQPANRSVVPPVAESAPANLVTPIIAPVVKRGRGRPRKNPVVMVPEPAVMPPVVAPPAAGDVAMVTAPPIQRKRGRPRKNPLIAAPDTVIKRPRGRPRKVQPESAEAAPAVKRKRGRPRKNPLPAEQERPVQ